MLAPVALLTVVLAATVTVVHAAFKRTGSLTAWALVVCLPGVWAAGRAVHCAIAFRGLPKKAKPTIEPGGPSGPATLDGGFRTVRPTFAESPRLLHRHGFE